MRTDGNAGNLVTGHGHPPLPTETRNTGTDLIDRLEQARQRRAIRHTWPDPPPKEPAPRTPTSRPAKPAATSTPPARRPTTARPAAAAPKKNPTRRNSTHVDTRQIVTRYTAGDTAPRIAADLGIALATVYRHLDIAGVPRRDDRTRHVGGLKSRLDRDQLVELYIDEGLSLAEVSRRVGSSPNNVRHHLLQAGVQLRGNHRPTTSKRREHIAGLYRAGWTVARICGHLDLSETVVRRDLKALGLNGLRDDRAGNGRHPSSRANLTATPLLKDAMAVRITVTLDDATRIVNALLAAADGEETDRPLSADRYRVLAGQLGDAIDALPTPTRNPPEEDRMTTRVPNR